MKKMYTNNENIWITKNGDALYLGEMTDSHILNAYRMVMRIKADLQEASSAAWSMSFQGEMAQYYQDQAIDSIDNSAQELLRMEIELFEEIKARRIQTLTKH